MGIDPELHVVEDQRAPPAAGTSQVSQELADEAGLTRVDHSSECAVTAPRERLRRHQPDLVPPGEGRGGDGDCRGRTPTARVPQDEECIREGH
ncbi:MAG: hypothetical protein LPK38_06965 [Actinomycetes bacterium]|nr:hypothetical protein [Actinomycetes bacterium]MDX5381028.1 hypothetical protein [Actinomycetes bacterium]MDX5400196.1 hypothetical protein [Actinomycetes bacterium]MDX5450782.1 hypothetical protein [Actinomycetes bacterium]